MKKWKRAAALMLAWALSMTLTGCFFRGADELYALPEPPKDYEALQVRLGEVAAQGGEYAAPLSGELIQSVQLQDLNGDGKQEAIAFFRFQGEEKPMKIYVFRQGAEGYELMTVVEGAGTAINCVYYVQLDDSPYREIVVSWQMSDRVHSLAAYSIGPERSEELLRTDYANYALSDLDQDNRQELLVVRTPSSGAPRAEIYDFQDGILEVTGTAPLSNNITGVAEGGVISGYLVDQLPALFVVSDYGESGTVTDIFTYREGKLKNITLDPETGESGETIRFYTQFGGTDINNDGIMELPQPVPLVDYKVTAATVNFWLIRWRQFDGYGRVHEVYTTYHNDRDGWYFVLPEEWGDDLSLSRSELPGGAERSVTFSHWEGDEQENPIPFLTIYKITGSNRVTRATMGNRFVLFPYGGLEKAGEATTLYAAELREGWDHGLTEEDVRNRFAIIKTDWSGGS